MMQKYYEKVLNRMRRPVLLVAVAIVALLSASGVAVAVNSLASGGAIEQVLVAGSTDPFIATSESYVDIPGASRTVFVSAGETDLLLARYSAESSVFGGERRVSSVRMVAQNGGTTLVMNPASPSGDFAFHNSSSDRDAGSHSMDRSLRVGSGFWTVKAQAAAFHGSSLRLDDWSLTVERAD
jgi:hypothetical protein